MPELIVAAMLLGAPVGAPVPHNPAPQLLAAVQDTAVRWELMDERERRYLAANPVALREDLDILRARRADLADAPPLADFRRFPPRDHLNDLLRCNRAYRRHLDDRLALELDRRPVLLVVIGETDDAYRAHDLARDAGCEWYYVATRRQALKRLRELLGPEAYAAADLPPAWPAWRMPEGR